VLPSVALRVAALGLVALSLLRALQAPRPPGCPLGTLLRAGWCVREAPWNSRLAEPWNSPPAEPVHCPGYSLPEAERAPPTSIFEKSCLASVSSGSIVARRAGIE